MDREILSRGKRLDNGEWVEGYYVPIGGQYHYIFTGKLDITGLYPTFDRHEVAPSTVGQYTGLTDKNGVRIFEGDIIRWVDWKKSVREAAVRYDPEWNRFCVWLNGAESMGVNHHLSEDIEVIGNVYDTPLLEPPKEVME